MLIESVELEGFGAFRERVTLGPFSPGLNVLAQRNEWGKSTVLKALTRALFDKYSAQSADIVALRPKGSSLSPRVQLVFRAAGERWQLRKRFLDGKASELQREIAGAWQRTDESDKADQRVRELLGAPKLESRAVKPETWGLIRYLWARQDEPAEWPDWEGSCGDLARRCLATVELDPKIGALLCRLDERRAALLTDTGRPRAKGPLDLAEQERARLEAELAELQARRAQTEALQQAYTRLGGEMHVLEAERARLRAEADSVKAEAEKAEKLQAGLTALLTAHTQADEALQQIRRDAAAFAEITRAIAEIATASAAREQDTARLTDEMPALETALADAQAALQRARQTRGGEEEAFARVRAMMRLRAAADEAAVLSAQQARVQAAEAALKILETRRAALPALTAARLKTWREWERTMHESAAQIEALGLRVTLTPKHAAKVIFNTVEAQTMAAGESATVKAPQSISLELEGWGRIEISSGAREIGELEETRRTEENKLAAGLSEAGLPGLAAAESAAQQAAELDQQMKAARTTLAALLGEYRSSDDLASAFTRALGALGQLQNLSESGKAEPALSLAALRSEEETLSAKIRASAQALERLNEAVEAARTRLEKGRRERATAASELATLGARQSGSLEQQKLLASRYEGQLDAALARAQGEFTRSEARLAEARRQLPAHAEKLPARSARAAKAAADTDAEFERKTSELREHEVLLRERGGEGLFTQIATTEEQLELARGEAARIREEAWALRLAAELIKRRQQSAIQTVLGPLEDRLSAALAELTGDHGRRVFFDEHLAIRGVGRSAEELVPFCDLSRGTREQLLLALRAAIALEIAHGEPTCLILDDVLVHTDPVRQQNVLDYLQTLAQRLQIVVLTCHAERYRGIGQPLAVSR